MIQFLVTLETLDSDDSVIIINIRVDSARFTDGKLSNLSRFLSGVFLFEHHLDVHCQRMLRHVVMLERMIAFLIGTPAIEALQAHVHACRGFL